MDPYAWDGKDVHFQGKGGDHQEMVMACDLILSTWPGPNARSRDTTEDRVGYTFENVKLVTCAKCREWMEANLKHCDRCGDLCCYGTCADCLDLCVCGTLLFNDDSKWRKYEKHGKDCTGRKMRVKKTIPESK